MKEALFYKDIGSGAVECLLCPHSCRIKTDSAGICGVRSNKDGKLYTLNHSRISSIALDPIEKKPLYRFHPGEHILSVGTVGCNLSCEFCQNWSISKAVQSATEAMTPQELVAQAIQLNSFGIAYTYNEPFIWYEFVLETAKLAKSRRLDNVLVTNGYVNPGPLKELLPFISAMNIDLKSIRDEFYKKVCYGRVAPVLETIKASAKDCHVELTNLVIPTLNDSVQDVTDLVDWIYANVGPEVPLHFSAYFPCFNMNIPATPLDSLKRAQEIARKKLKYVYLGNV